MSLHNESWSVNALSGALDVDRRTLRRHLADVQPAEDGTHGPRYRLRDVFKALRQAEYVPPLSDPMDRAFWDLGELLGRALRRGLAQRLADAKTPAAASRVVREFYADLYYRLVKRLEGGPKAPDWTSADGPTFERAYRMIRSHDWVPEEVAEVLRERLAELEVEGSG
jgi:hypothetical protein